MTDTGGDPACWADRVCAACGMLDERDAGVRDGTCPHCEARQDDDLPTPHRAGPAATPGDPATSPAAPAPGPTVDR